MALNLKKCTYYGSLKTDIGINEKGNKYQKWISDPNNEGKWICWKCYRNLLFLKARPPNYVRRNKLKKRYWRLSK